MPESTHAEAPAEVRAAGDWTPLWIRIKQVATEQPDVRPDMKPGQFERILKLEKRPSTTDLALIADAFGVTVPWLVTGADEDADVLALLGREAKRARQEIAAVGPQAGLADLKRRPKNPKPVVGYLVSSNPDDYTANTKRGWFFLPPLNCTIKGAEDRQVGFQAMAPASPPKPIFKVTITFELVKGGSGDD